MSSGNEPDKPIKNWHDYEEIELDDYILQNIGRSDCSFLINDPSQNKDSKRELRSFKWILCEISPVLKEILTDEKKQKSNFKSIPISDTNFETLLSYAHTKNFFATSFDFMLNFYESSKQYSSEPLSNAIAEYLKLKDPIGNWIRFAAIAYRDSKYNTKLYDIFHTIRYSTKEWQKIIECELNSNLETVLTFDSNLFLNFLKFTRCFELNPLLCFKAAEAYLLKNIFEGNITENIKEDNLNIDTVKTIFTYVKFSKMSLKDFNDGPAKSKLLDEESQNYFRTLVRK